MVSVLQQESMTTSPVMNLITGFRPTIEAGSKNRCEQIVGMECRPTK
jgi:hypothetical protein